MHIVLLIHFLATSFMTGVIWFCQVVHYPLFRHIPQDAFCDYEQKNMVTGYVVVPAMLIELGSCLLLLWLDFSVLYILNTALLGVIWISTAVFQGPLHTRLTKEADQVNMAKLVRTNWVRTAAWTLRSFLVMYILYLTIK